MPIVPATLRRSTLARLRYAPAIPVTAALNNRVAVNPNGSAGALSIFADGATINAAHHTTGALDGADGIVFDASGRLWICANQANEVQILSPSGKSLVKRFSGTGDNAMNFPASPVFVGHAMFVANLYFATPGAGKISVLGAAPGAP